MSGLFFVFAVFVALPTMAQQAAPLTPEEAAARTFESWGLDTSQANPDSVRLTGRQVPFHMLVEDFFAFVGAVRSSEIWSEFLSQRLGIKPDSPQAQALLSALADFEAWRALKYQPATEAEQAADAALFDADRAAWGAQLTAEQKETAGQLGDIYSSLAEALAANGTAMDGVESYILGPIADGASMTAAGPLNADFFSVGAEFNRRAGLAGAEQ